MRHSFLRAQVYCPFWASVGLLRVRSPLLVAVPFLRALPSGAVCRLCVPLEHAPHLLEGFRCALVGQISEDGRAPFVGSHASGASLPPWQFAFHAALLPLFDAVFADAVLQHAGRYAPPFLGFLDHALNFPRPCDALLRFPRVPQVRLVRPLDEDFPPRGALASLRHPACRVNSFHFVRRGRVTYLLYRRSAFLHASPPAFPYACPPAFLEFCYGSIIGFPVCVRAESRESLHRFVPCEPSPARVRDIPPFSYASCRHAPRAPRVLDASACRPDLCAYTAACS